MKLSTELRNLPIVSIAEGEEVGVVKDFIVDPAAKSIVAVIIEDPKWYEGAKVIAFNMIHSIGDFAITTDNVSSVVALAGKPELTDLINKCISVIGAKVITRGGRLVGFVKEYSIESNTGEILGLELSSDSEVISPDRTIIPSSSVVTIGKDVIIVNEDVESNLRASHHEIAPEAAAPSAPPRRPAPTPPPPPPRREEPAPPAQPQPEPGGIEAESEVDLESLLEIEEETPSEISAEPAEALAEDTAKESLSEIFERRQIKYMLGKKVSRDIESDDGTMIIRAGAAITDDVINKAKKAGKFLELSMNIEIEE
ncbi:MAG: PRC-barrel domain-containing protein [bacterium]